jgi:spermidine synthase
MISRKLLPLGLVAVLALCVIALAEQKVLYEKDSPYNTIVVTEDDQGLRTLWFDSGGVRQSVVKVGDPDHIELAYARVMPVGLAFVDKPQRVLIVGLGGGTIPGFLHKHYPQTAIDVVDIDPDVLHVAKKFFGFREDRTMRAYVDDGRRFIEKCQDPYDIIFLDAFGSENIPYHLATREFLQAVRRALTPKGIAVGNIWSRTSNPLYDSMVLTYQDVFDELYIFDVRGAGNEILVALPREQRINRDDLARRARTISKEKHFRFDMGEMVTYGYRHAGEKDFGGRVLTDNKKAKRAG